MKRRIFFWLEKLKITRAERKAITWLMLIFLLLFAIQHLLPQNIPFDNSYYSTLEAEFKKRSDLLRQKENAILARYDPQQKELAVFVEDTVTKDTTKATEPGIQKTSAVSADKINVNTADAKTLESLPGIGPAYAIRIIEYRNKNGLFESYEELLKIKGIGKKRLEKLLPFIQLKEPIENK